MELPVQIRRMPVDLANKIAAGEVVQRPASAVKELLENAIDADATEITIVIKASGRTLIRVQDNGIGMGPEDAALCFERHATSKITSTEDLARIRTMGFRGEALASIAAIAQVSLKTGRRDDHQGVHVHIEGGELLETSPCPARQGTTIDVRNLYYNVPARRSFLKAPSTEFRHITDVFTACALANPWTTFKLEHNGQDIHVWTGARTENFQDAVRDRLRTILGSTVVQHIVPVEEASSYISVNGFLAHPEHAFKNRKHQYLFVNGRPVKSASLRHAIRSAYDPILPEGRQPAYALFITIDPQNIDVNVHPAKIEVRFDDDRGVYNFLQAICRRSLGIADLIPQHPGTASSLDFQKSPSGSWQPPPRADQLEPVHGDQTSIIYEVEPSRLPEGAVPETGGFLWQLQQRYILTQLNRGIMVVDQNAAHQRILFERALEDASSGAGLCQQLLFPRLICVTEQDCELLRELDPIAKALGFDYSISENRTVSVQGVPSHIRVGAEKDLLQSILSGYKAETTPLSMEERMARSVAASGAIQPGAKLNEEEMRTLIDQLFECQQPYLTPDRMPTLVRISMEELKRRFDQRIVDDDGDLYEQLL